MKKLFSNPKVAIILIAEISLAITLLLSTTLVQDKEIVMFVLGAFAGIISVETLDTIG